MHGDQLTRRLFLQGSGSVAGSSLMRAALPGVMALAGPACTARDNDASFSVLTDDDAIEFAAIADRILPTTDTPGAREAGVIHFIDQAFAGLMQDLYAQSVSDLATFQAGVGEAFPGKTRFSELNDAQQDRYLEAQDASSFFQLLHRMTIYGFFGMQSYGGNRDQVGWQLLGFEPRHAWQAPFGHYDDPALQGEPGGD